MLGLWHSGPEPGTHVVGEITTPSGFEQFITELGRPAEHPGLPAPTPPDIPRLIEAGQRYGHQILGPPST